MLDPDLDEYLTEYRLQAPAEPISHYEGTICIYFSFLDKYIRFIFGFGTVSFCLKKKNDFYKAKIQ